MKGPPQAVQEVMLAILNLLAGRINTIEVDKNGKLKREDWNNCIKMMSNPSYFL